MIRYSRQVVRAVKRIANICKHHSDINTSKARVLYVEAPYILCKATSSVSNSVFEVRVSVSPQSSLAH